MFSDCISQCIKLSKRDFFIVTTAAWFHDMGYFKGAENHEEKGAKMCRVFRGFNSNFAPSQIQGAPRVDLTRPTCILPGTAESWRELRELSRIPKPASPVRKFAPIRAIRVNPASAFRVCMPLDNFSICHRERCLILFPPFAFSEKPAIGPWRRCPIHP